MKINEKNIAGFAVSNSPIDKEGWLLKRGEVNKTFQRRWFILKGNLLFYFEKKTEKEPAGVIILEGCTIELAEYEEQYAFKIVFHGAGDRTYVLGADTQETMESWMKSLARASYDYMKLMVSELQRKLDEIVELEKAHSVSIFGDRPALTPPQHQRQSGIQKAASFSKAETNRTEAECGFPVVPPRRKGSQVRRDQRALPMQRINPFDRCQSEEDVEKRSTPAAMSNSAPGTPRCHRYNSGDSARPSGDALRSHEKFQGRPRHRSANQVFDEVHSTYGERVMGDVLNWQQKVARVQPPLVAEARLIEFD